MNDTTLLSTLTVGEFKELMQEVMGKPPTKSGQISPKVYKPLSAKYKLTGNPHREYDQSCNCEKCVARRLRAY